MEVEVVCFSDIFFVERNHPAVLLIAAVVTILSKEGTKTLKHGYHLNIVASAVHADALAIVTSELMGKTGAEL